MKKPAMCVSLSYDKIIREPRRFIVSFPLQFNQGNLSL